MRLASGLISTELVEPGQGESFLMAGIVVAGSATKPDHRILLLGFEAGAAEEIRVLVCPKAVEPEKHIFRKERRGL